MSVSQLLRWDDHAKPAHPLTNRAKLSGTYRNACPGLTEITVRDLPKSVSVTSRNTQVMATKTDYDRFASDLADIGRPVVVGFEATGNYHRTLAHRLLSVGFELRLISSVQFRPCAGRSSWQDIEQASGEGRRSGGATARVPRLC